MEVRATSETISGTTPQQQFLQLAKTGLSFLAAALSLIFIVWVVFTFAEASRSPEWRESTITGNLFVNFTLPLLMAGLFWGVGMWAWSIRTQPFGPIYFLTIAATLAAGVLSAVSQEMGGPWFALFQIWVAPVFLHMHLELLAPSFPRFGQWLLRAFYCFAILLTIPLIFVPVAEWETVTWFPLWRTALRLNLAAGILTTLVLVGYYYSTNANALQRRWIRLLFCGTILAISPLLCLSLLPELVRAPYSVPYTWTLPFLVLNPLSYAYVIGMRRQQLRYELFFQRFASYYLAITLLLSAFFLALAFVHRLLPDDLETRNQYDLAVGIGLMILFVPLLRQVQIIVRRIWYGREMTSQKMVVWVSEALSRTLDWSSLARLLLEELPSAMVLQHCAAYSEKDLNGFTLLGASGSRATAPLPARLPANSTLINYLLRENRPVAHETLRQALADAMLSTDEQALIYTYPPAFWLPLMSREQIHGILMLGPRLGDDWISVEDVHVLETLVNQTGVAVHNVRLIEEVRAGRQELADAHQQLLMAREQERQSLARELHDDAVQQLIGIGYQIQLAQKSLHQTTPTEVKPVIEELGDMNENVIDVVRTLRLLIRELRPTGLEHIGLIPTLLAYIKNLQSQHPSITIQLEATPLHSYLSEEIIMGLFRVTQEAVRNSIRHANPTKIVVKVERINHHIELAITDNGRGFDVPTPLTQLAQKNHYGLVGLAERIALLGGEYQIESKRGYGTTISVTIPLRGERGHEPKDAGYSRG
jgi:signal transduction histidine kinase